MNPNPLREKITSRKFRKTAYTSIPWAVVGLICLMGALSMYWDTQRELRRRGAWIEETKLWRVEVDAALKDRMRDPVYRQEILDLIFCNPDLKRPSCFEIPVES